MLHPSPFVSTTYAILDGKGFEHRCSCEGKSVKNNLRKRATQECGKQASKVEMSGEIVRKEGAGPATKWLVRWDKPQCESAWNARSEAGSVADEGPDDSTNDESSDSDEAPDVVDADPMVERVVSLQLT